MKLNPLDILFSKYIRLRAMKRVHGCERCLNYKKDYKELQCSHFIGRSNHSTRWDEDDCVGLCGACHIYFGSHPLEHMEFFKNRLGEQAFDLLNARARIIQKVDRNAITLYLKAKIQELED